MRRPARPPGVPIPEAITPRPVPASDAGRDRTVWADVAKGMCILLVVLWHVVTKHYLRIDWHVSPPIPGAWGVLTEQLLPMRMPLFFTISGMFAIGAVRRPWRVLGRSKVATVPLPLHGVATDPHRAAGARPGLRHRPRHRPPRPAGPVDDHSVQPVVPVRARPVFRHRQGRAPPPGGPGPGSGPDAVGRGLRGTAGDSRQPRRPVPEPRVLPRRPVLPAARRTAGRHREPATPGRARCLLRRRPPGHDSHRRPRLARCLAGGLRPGDDPRRDRRRPDQPMGAPGQRAGETRTQHPARLHHPHAPARTTAPGAPAGPVHRHGRQATAAAHGRRTAPGERTPGVAVPGASPGTPEVRRHLAVRPAQKTRPSQGGRARRTEN